MQSLLGIAFIVALAWGVGRAAGGGGVDRRLWHRVSAALALQFAIAAVLLKVPAAVLIARLMVPPEADDEADDARVLLPQTAQGSMDAITQGTVDGVKLLINVIAMLIVMVALVSLVNAVLGLLPDAGGAALTLERMLGWVLAPLAWLIGIPWDQAATAGGLLGTKVILNEFIAYIGMANTPSD
ncbi:MAG: nucleoside transporter C-terminal domain-containing protein, partial [Rhodospirillaceae bacterium]